MIYPRLALTAAHLETLGSWYENMILLKSLGPIGLFPVWIPIQRVHLSLPLHITVLPPLQSLVYDCKHYTAIPRKT